MTIAKDLFAMQDNAYREFHSKLMPTICKDTIIGVRVPALRTYAGTVDETVASAFMACLPHKYYEENNLHAFLINKIKDFAQCMKALDTFLPFVDNWATCDGLRPKCVKKHKREFLTYIRKWLHSDHPYTIRFAMEMLMIHYLDGDFREEYPQLIASVCSNEYYVNMMAAWYFATALAVQYDCVIGYLEHRKLSPWVHRATIQKAVESRRLSEVQKDYLRTLK